VAAGVVLVWAITGPLSSSRTLAAHYQNRHDHRHVPDGVFLIQNSRTATAPPSRSSWTSSFGSARAKVKLVGIEHLTDRLEEIRSKCERRAGVDSSDDQDGKDCQGGPAT
jgi:low affinity Fe/Cu permease